MENDKENKWHSSKRRKQDELCEIKENKRYRQDERFSLELAAQIELPLDSDEDHLLPVAEDPPAQLKMYLPLQPSPGHFSQLIPEYIRIPAKKHLCVAQQRRVDVLKCLSDRGAFAALDTIVKNVSQNQDDIKNMRLVSRQWLNMIDSICTRTDRKRRLGNSENDENVFSDLQNEVYSKRSRKEVLSADSMNRLVEQNEKKVDDDNDVKESPVRELLNRTHSNRKYKRAKCPRCSRESLEDLTYQRGQCGFASCKMEYCVLCRHPYHPLEPCIDYKYALGPKAPPGRLYRC
ncbi:hypothetical protein ACOME3_003712 [Neoechinorhynchus agilis]